MRSFQSSCAPQNNTRHDYKSTATQQSMYSGFSKNNRTGVNRSENFANGIIDEWIGVLLVILALLMPGTF